MLHWPAHTKPDDWSIFYREMSINASLPDALQKFYQAGLPNVAAPLSETPMVALDLETTGLSPEHDDIVSIGLVPFSAQRIQLAKAQHWVVRSQKLEADSVTIHGLTHAQVSQAPTLASVLPDVLLALRGRVPVVHFRLMEREFLREAGKRLGFEPLLFPVLDTQALEANWLKSRQPRWRRWLQQPLPSTRLPQTRPRYGLPDYPNHNALTDAIATAELLQAQMQHQNLQNSALGELIS